MRAHVLHSFTSVLGFWVHYGFNAVLSFLIWLDIKTLAQVACTIDRSNSRLKGYSRQCFSFILSCLKSATRVILSVRFVSLDSENIREKHQMFLKECFACVVLFNRDVCLMFEEYFCLLLHENVYSGCCRFK